MLLICINLRRARQAGRAAEPVIMVVTTGQTVGRGERVGRCGGGRGGRVRYPRAERTHTRYNGRRGERAVLTRLELRRHASRREQKRG